MKPPFLRKDQVKNIIIMNEYSEKTDDLSKVTERDS